MKRSSPTRELLRLVWPLYISQIAWMANGVIDTVMAGRLSALDLAAVGIGLVNVTAALAIYIIVPVIYFFAGSPKEDH